MSLDRVKKSRGRPATGKGVPVTTRLQPVDLDALDRWILEQPDPKPSRPEVLRSALREWMTSLGRLSTCGDPEMAN